MGDLDKFKAINDSCGHKAGDELLIQLTRIIKKNIRSHDTLARIGGDGGHRGGQGLALLELLEPLFEETLGLLQVGHRARHVVLVQDAEVEVGLWPATIDLLGALAAAGKVHGIVIVHLPADSGGGAGTSDGSGYYEVAVPEGSAAIGKKVRDLDEIADRVVDEDRPVVYAGDCVSIIGVLAGLQLRDTHPTLVFFDAHGDFNFSSHMSLDDYAEDNAMGKVQKNRLREQHG